MTGRIFTGREARYNELILKVLYENDSLTVWALSKEIAKLTCDKPMGNIRHKALNIQSRLIGKHRRLEYLVSHQFLKEHEKKYYLTFKGMCSASVSFDERETPKPKWTMVAELGRSCPALAVSMQALSTFFSEEYKESHKQIRDVTNRLLDRNLKFEDIPDNMFLDFFDAEYNQFYIQVTENNELSYNKGSIEVQEALVQVVTKANELMQTQAKNFDIEARNFIAEKINCNDVKSTGVESYSDRQKERSA